MSLGRFRNYNLLEMDNFRRHGVEDEFEFEGRVYRSLSAIATEVTGTKWNGFLFFNCGAAAEASNGKK